MCTCHIRVDTALEFDEHVVMGRLNTHRPPGTAGLVGPHGSAARNQRSRRRRRTHRQHQYQLHTKPKEAIEVEDKGRVYEKKKSIPTALLTWTVRCPLQFT